MLSAWLSSLVNLRKCSFLSLEQNLPKWKKDVKDIPCWAVELKLSIEKGGDSVKQKQVEIL
jgi:hypothetical protein